MEAPKFDHDPSMLRRSFRAIARVVFMPELQDGPNPNIGEAGLRGQGLAQARQDFIRESNHPELPPAEEF